MGKRILFLADVNSSHTRKLAEGLSGAGFHVGIFSLSGRKSEWFTGNQSISIFDRDAMKEEVFHGSMISKLAYVARVRTLKRVIREFRPDLVHAHYATSYGILGWRTGFHPFIISVWGSDVLDFPRNGFRRSLLKKILLSADQVMATSHTLETAVRNICGRSSLITPFGVNADQFSPGKIQDLFPAGTLVFGTVKSLEKVYGIDTLIRAFAGLLKSAPHEKIGLLIVGDGTQRAALEELVSSLGIIGHVKFAGRRDHSEITDWHKRIDVFMNLSVYESFGVSVLEAMASEKPVIVSDTGGLAEIVNDGIQGYRVPVGDAGAAAEAMKKLLKNEKLRRQFGKSGRERVIGQYSWQATMQTFQSAYAGILKENA